MAEYYAIITNYGSDPSPKAHLDVGVDTLAGGGSPVDVLFTVYSAIGVPITEFTSTTNANGHASSSANPSNDLFLLSSNQPALVRARTPNAAGTSAVMLRQSGAQNKLAYNIAPAVKSSGTTLAQGTIFQLVLGNLGAGATAALLIAGVGGSEVAVDVYTGTAGGTGGGKYSNPALNTNAIWRVDLQASDEKTHLVIRATGGDIIVQQVIDFGGKVDVMTCLPA
jgi:hypothetical protein